MIDPSWSPDPATGIAIRTVRAGGLDFEVAEAGAGDHLALCLHGFPELAYSWRHQIPVLVDKGYRVWAPNLRGYGASSRPADLAAYRMDVLTDDIGALIDASGAARVTLIAHDWGGALAWQAAIRKIRPIERLVVMNMPHPAGFRRALRHWPQKRRSWYIAFFQLPWLPERVLGRNDAAWIRRAFRGMAVDRSRFPDEVLDVYARAASQPWALTAMINWYRAMRLGGGVGGRVDIPTLLIWGEADTALGLESIEGIERDVPDITIRRLPGVSHWVQQEAPEAVNAILAEWLPRG